MRQHDLAREMDSSYPKVKGNIGQQMFRSCYYNHRMSGDSHEVAREGSIATVRQHVPGFTPIEHMPPPMVHLVPRHSATSIRESRWMRKGAGQHRGG